MNERHERIERLAERWFAAQTTDAEECELREWFRQATDVPDSLREAQALFGGLDALAGECSPEQWKPRPARRISLLWGFASRNSLSGAGSGKNMVKRSRGDKDSGKKTRFSLSGWHRCTCRLSLP